MKLPPGNWSIPSPGKLVKRDVQVSTNAAGEEEATVIATYDEGTVITMKIDGGGNPNVHINRDIRIDVEKRTVEILKN